MTSKMDQRSDRTKWRRAVEADPPIGAHNDNWTYVVDRGTKVGTWRIDIEQPECSECGSGNVRYDENGDSVCRNCRLVISNDPVLVRDKIAANQINNDDPEQR